MELRNSFFVPGRPGDVFALLLDVEQVAPCMPGATLLGSEGAEHRGEVRLKVGPITAAYRGTVTIDRADPVERRAELTARGQEVGGQGTAQAGVVATVEADGDGSRVTLVTDLQVGGKAAQFGRGVLADVAGRVIAQFARNLEALLRAPDAGDVEGAAAVRAAATPGVAAVPSADGDLDLVALLGPLVGERARQALPLLGVALVAFVLGRWSGRRGGPGRAQPWAPPPWASPSPWTSPPPWASAPPWSGAPGSAPTPCRQRPTRSGR